MTFLDRHGKRVALALMVLSTILVLTIASVALAKITHGGPGSDTLKGTQYKDKLYGEQGNDFLAGRRGDDLLVGGEGGKDECDGGPGRDRFLGCEIITNR